MRHAMWRQLFLREGGSADAGGTLLLVHGLGESGLGFEALLRRSELRGWRLIAPDLPGYGRTAWPPRPLDLAAQADLLAELVADLVRGPVVALGHSLGAVTALLLAERHPQAVRALVDLEGNKSLADCTFSSTAADQDATVFAAIGFDELREQVYRQGVTDAALRGYYASLRLADPWTFHANSEELVAASTREDLAKRLAARPLPALFVAGAPDGACARSLELVRQAGVPTVEIAPSGHWPHLDQPDAFVAALVGFLRELA